jgi:hypothetical protein
MLFMFYKNSRARYNKLCPGHWTQPGPTSRRKRTRGYARCAHSPVCVSVGPEPAPGLALDVEIALPCAA